MIPTDPNSLKFKKAKFKNKTASTAKTGECALEFVNNVFTVIENGVAKTTSITPSVHAASGAIAASECYNGLVNNYGQTDDATHTLPTATAGMSLIVVFGTAVAKYFRLDPAAGQSIYYEGITTGNGKYIGVAATVVGYTMQLISFQTGASAYSWIVMPNFSGLVVEA